VGNQISGLAVKGKLDGAAYRLGVFTEYDELDFKLANMVFEISDIEF
jgi:hypothetical protein